jgi:hypothetical protein
MNCYGVLSFFGTKFIVEAAADMTLATSMRRKMLAALEMVRKRLMHARKKDITLAISIFNFLHVHHYFAFLNSWISHSDHYLLYRGWIVGVRRIQFVENF